MRDTEIGGGGVTVATIYVLLGTRHCSKHFACVNLPTPIATYYYYHPCPHPPAKTTWNNLQLNKVEFSDMLQQQRPHTMADCGVSQLEGVWRDL